MLRRTLGVNKKEMTEGLKKDKITSFIIFSLKYTLCPSASCSKISKSFIVFSRKIGRCMNISIVYLSEKFRKKSPITTWNYLPPKNYCNTIFITKIKKGLWTIYRRTVFKINRIDHKCHFVQFFCFFYCFCVTNSRCCLLF